MPFDRADVPERLIEAVRNRALVPLVGAGMSRQAGDEFPGWSDLLLHMRDRGVARGHLTAAEGEELERLVRRGQSLMAAEALRHSLPVDEYESILTAKFHPKRVPPTKAHRALFHLSPPLILTTNYDRLLEDAFAEEFRRAPLVITHREAVTVQRFLQGERYTDDRPVIFKLHGTIDNPESVMLSERDYRNLVYRQPGYRLVLSAIFLTQVVLMIGFSFADPELRLLLEEMRESLKYRSHPDYLFLPADSAGPVETRRLRDDFGVQVIPYEPSPGHPEVLEFIEYLTAEAAKTAPQPLPYAS